MKRLLGYISILFLLVSFYPKLIFAQSIGKDWNDIVADCAPNGVATLKCIPAVFQNIVLAALTFSGIVAIFLVIFSGIKFITSRGDAKQIEGARNTLTFAIIGFLLILFSFFIVNIISYVTGARCITVFGFDSCK